MSEFDNSPSFQAMVRASGLAEVWTHSTELHKFNQFGWRCTNKESSYTNCTLIGNWNEDRFDNSRVMQAKPLPSQVSEDLCVRSSLCPESPHLFQTFWLLANH